jgi:hypothetical protein
MTQKVKVHASESLLREFTSQTEPKMETNEAIDTFSIQTPMRRHTKVKSIP